MKKVKAGKIIGNIIFYLVLIFFIAVSVIMIKARSSGVQPSVFGYKFYIVLTGSMTPAINPGDLVVVKESDASEIKQGDVITFGSPNNKNITTHRVKKINNKNGIQFVTQGDANDAEDPTPVEEKFLVGKVTAHISKIGTVMQSIQNHLKEIIIIILLLGLFLFLLQYLLSRKKKAEDKQKEENK